MHNLYLICLKLNLRVAFAASYLPSGSFVAWHHVTQVTCCVNLSQFRKQRRPCVGFPVPTYKLSLSHCQTCTQGMMVSSYSGAKTLLECFFRVTQQENTCKDKVQLGRGLSVAAWVTLPYTWHGLPWTEIKWKIFVFKVREILPNCCLKVSGI